MLKAARIRYAASLHAAITQAAAHIVNASAGIEPHHHPLIASWNASLDTDVGGLDSLTPTMQARLATLFDSFASQHAAYLKHTVHHVFNDASPTEVRAVCCCSI